MFRRNFAESLETNFPARCGIGDRGAANLERPRLQAGLWRDCHALPPAEFVVGTTQPAAPSNRRSSPLGIDRERKSAGEF
jgi:hypothetical protein